VQSGEVEQLPQLARGAPKLHGDPQAPGDQLEPRQVVDRCEVHVGKSGHVAQGGGERRARVVGTGQQGLLLVSSTY
jgi:hypothetical protein